MISEFLTELFGEFKNHDVNFVILRNYEALPHKMTGNDIDFLVDPKSFSSIEQIIAATKGVLILNITRHSYVKMFLVSFNKNFYIKLDFHPNEQWQGLVYLSAGEILQEKKSHNTFFVPSEIHESTISFFSSFLSGGFVNEKYLPFISRIYQVNKTRIFQVFSPRMGKKNFEKIYNFLSGNEKLSARKSILYNLFFYNFFRHPIDTIARQFCFVWHEITLAIYPKGVFIVILGVDGSGKSTVISALKKNLEVTINEKNVFMFHFCPSPRYNKKHVAAVTNPHSQKPYNFFIIFIKELFLLFHFITGFMLLVKNHLRKSHFVIGDRYFYDTMIDFKRFRFNGNFFFRKIISFFIPRPDMVFFLHANADLLFARKPETSVSEINLSQERLFSVAQGKKNWFGFDSSKLSADEISEKITSHLIEFLRNRYLKSQ